MSTKFSIQTIRVRPLLKLSKIKTHFTSYWDDKIKHEMDALISRVQPRNASMILSAKSTGKRSLNGDWVWDDNMEVHLKKVGVEVWNEFM
jgi:hypothetical protein